MDPLQDMTLSFEGAKQTRIIPGHILEQHPNCMLVQQMITQPDCRHIHMTDMKLAEFDQVAAYLLGKDITANQRTQELLFCYGFSTLSVSNPISNPKVTTPPVKQGLITVCKDIKDYRFRKHAASYTQIPVQLLTIDGSVVFCSYYQGIPIYLTNHPQPTGDLTNRRAMTTVQCGLFSNSSSVGDRAIEDIDLLPCRHRTPEKVMDALSYERRRGHNGIFISNQYNEGNYTVCYCRSAPTTSSAVYGSNEIQYLEYMYEQCLNILTTHQCGPKFMPTLMQPVSATILPEFMESLVLNMARAVHWGSDKAIDKCVIPDGNGTYSQIASHLILVDTAKSNG